MGASVATGRMLVDIVSGLGGSYQLGGLINVLKRRGSPSLLPWPLVRQNLNAQPCDQGCFDPPSPVDLLVGLAVVALAVMSDVNSIAGICP